MAKTRTTKRGSTKRGATQANNASNKQAKTISNSATGHKKKSSSNVETNASAWEKNNNNTTAPNNNKTDANNNNGKKITLTFEASHLRKENIVKPTFISNGRTSLSAFPDRSNNDSMGNQNKVSAETVTIDNDDYNKLTVTSSTATKYT
jgi:uncharacterized protein YxeA